MEHKYTSSDDDADAAPTNPPKNDLTTLDHEQLLRSIKLWNYTSNIYVCACVCAHRVNDFARAGTATCDHAYQRKVSGNRVNNDLSRKVKDCDCDARNATRAT